MLLLLQEHNSAFKTFLSRQPTETEMLGLNRITAVAALKKAYKISASPK